MYVRLARFDGADPEVLERELESMRKQMKSDAADDSGGSEGGQGPDAEQMKWLRQVTKRVLVLADREKGSSAMLVFVDSEEDARKIDEMFDQMSPSTDGGGKRQSADVYEVAIDEQMS
jgi:hypothetical protein